MELPADVANDDDIALLAQLLVPVNTPTKDPVNDPVLTWAELDTSVGLLSRVLKSAADTLAA